MKWPFCWTTVVVTAAALGFATAAHSQESPQPDGPPVPAEVPTPFQYEEKTSVHTRGGTATSRIERLPTGVYYSANLHGFFRAEWMSLPVNGRVASFWGARIASLQPDSPLLSLGVRPGDVITRLDGLPISLGMFRTEGGPWQITQLENHFGATEVRFVIQGNPYVRVGQINIDNDDFNGGGRGLEP